MSIFVPFALCIIGGWFFMTIVIVGRKLPFLTENGNSWDFIILLFMIPFIFFTSTANCWRSKHSKMCAIIGQLPHPCEWKTPAEVILYNNFSWTPGFILGLHFTLLSEKVVPEYSKWSFTASSFARMSDKQKTGLAVVLALFVTCVGINMYIYITEQMWCILYISLAWVLFFFAGTFVNMQGRSFHFHHWTVGFVITTLLSYPDWIFAFFHGLMCGLMLDGSARWGWDPVWELTSDLAPGKWDIEQRIDD
jgi:hypothetical protein